MLDGNVFAFDLANSAARLWTVHLIHVFQSKNGYLQGSTKISRSRHWHVQLSFHQDETLGKTMGNVIVSRGALIDTKIPVAGDRWLMARKSPGSPEMEMTTKDCPLIWHLKYAKQ